MMRRALLVLTILAGLGAVFVTHAQIGTTDPLTITINPSYPRPYQIITVTPESTLIDLNGSTVTVSVNGTVVQRGSGGESASVAVGGPGTVTTITVTAVNNGETYTKSLSIHPADVALILEPTSTTHPFYEGASLVGGEGRLRVIAIPDLRTSSGVPLAPANLVYTWKNGDQILQASSGIGKSVLTATAPVRYRDTTISVTVSTPDQSVVGQASLYIAATDPIMRIYESDPLLGPRYENALPASVSLLQNEGTYRAVPYYFTQTPTLTWSMNGTATQTGTDITVRPSGAGKGTARLDVAASSASATSIGQAADKSLVIQFGNTSSGIFGI